MAFKFTIGRKIGTGFGVLLLLTMIAFMLTIVTVTKSKQQTESVVSKVTPSVSALKEYNFLLQKSQTLISKWYYNPSRDDEPFKNELRSLINKDYPNIKTKITSLSRDWTKDEQEKFKAIVVFTDGLFKVYKTEIMSALSSFDSYKDASLYFTAEFSYGETEEKIKALYRQLNQLIEQKQNKASSTTDEMFKSFNFLEDVYKRQDQYRARSTVRQD